MTTTETTPLADLMPKVRTAQADLTAEHRRIGNRLLPHMSLTFVEHHVPEALPYAKQYDRARDKFLHFCPVPGEGYVFDPKLFERALYALDCIVNRIPEHLQTGVHYPKANA